MKLFQIKNNKNKQKGFLAIEILLGASIITVSVLASMFVTQKSIYISRQSFHATQAAFLLEEGAEAVRIIRDNAWNNISSLTNGTNYYLSFSGGTWILSQTPSVVGIFTRTVVATSVNRNSLTQDIASVGTDDPQTKLFTVTVSWPEGGTTITKTLKLYVMDLFS